MNILLALVMAAAASSNAAPSVSLGAMAAQGGAAAGAGSLESASAGAGASFEGFAAPPSPVRVGEGGEPRSSDLSLAADRPAPTQVPVPRAATPKTPGIGGGIVTGAQEGAMAGFSVVLQPAVALVVKGERSGNSWYTAAGFALAAVSYIPALAVAGLTGLGGSAAGGVAEAVSPGSTKDWCGECVVD